MRVDRIHCGIESERTALVAGKAELSYGAFEAQVQAAASGFARMGLAPGDRAAVWLPKTLEGVAALFGIMRAGGIAIPVNPALKAPQVAHILSDSGAKLLLANAARAETLGPVQGCGILTVERDWPALASGEGDGEAARMPEDLAMILYTSGSTGLPKGVMLSHRNLYLGAESVAAYLEIGEADRTLCVLPLSFDYGFNQVLTALRQGGTAVLFDYLLPRDVVRAVERHRITGLAGVPPLWLQLAEVDWPEAAAHSLRYITNSGGHMPETLTRRYMTLLPSARIYLMYGLTEAFRSTYLDPALVTTHAGSMGRAIPHAELFVLRPDGSEAADDEPGELVHAGPLVSHGYWKDEARTAARFRLAPAASRYGGMAVWSGDTVKRAADGLLYFVGREDEMIKTSGNRVSPAEIEEAAFATGAVAEAAAFGVTDDRLGQAILLHAVPAAGLEEAEAMSRLKVGLAAALPSFMQPKAIRWSAALPRNPNGKIDRSRLKREASA